MVEELQRMIQLQQLSNV